MYINDVPIDADRCGFTDGSGAKVPLIVGVQNGVVRFRVASAKIDIYLNPSSPLQDATITSTSNNTNITFGTAEMPLEEVYTLMCGTYTVLLLPTSPNENHVQYWFNEYDTSDSSYSYFIDKSGTATYNTDSGYNGGHTTFNFYTRVFRVNQGRLYDPVNLSNPANVSTDGITLVKFDLIDNTDGAKEPIWPTSGGYDGAIYTVNSGALTLSGNLLVNGVFPASQYGVKFKIRNGSNNDISYYISLSGAQVIPISSVDDSLRRWNDIGSILSSITYKNTDTGPSITIGLADLYNNFASELGSASYGTVLTNNPANAQQAFNEFYLFYSRGMGSGALYSNSNDHMRFTMFINKILNSTGAQYLQKKGLPDIQDGAIITAQFDRVIGIRMYMHEEQNQYYLYNNTPLYGKQYFERKTSGGAYFPIEIKGSVQYGGFLNNYGSALGVEPFPVYKESIYKDDNNVQYQIWGYCLTHSTPSLNDLDELYCLTGENGINPDITPFYWSDITIQNWLNTKMFTEMFKYVQSPDAKIGLKAEVMWVNGSASTTVPAQILCNGTTYATTSPGNNVDLNVNKNDSIKIDKVSYTIDGKTYISYPKISFTYGGTVAGGYDSGFQYNPSNNKLTIYVRELTVYTVDYNVNFFEIPHSDFFEGMVNGRNDYVIHNCWYDESGNLVIFDNAVGYMATENKVYYRVLRDSSQRKRRTDKN